MPTHQVDNRTFATDDLFVGASALYLLEREPDEMIPVRFKTRAGTSRIKIMLKWNNVNGELTHVDQAAIPVHIFRKLYLNLKRRVTDLARERENKDEQQTYTTTN